jgi:hypothetical protein
MSDYARRRGADVETARSFVEGWNDADEVFHNLAEEQWSNHCGFVYAVLACNQVHDVEDANKFFSSANSRSSCPSLLLFASRDEAEVGRCATVEVKGFSLAITLVHSQIDVEDIFDLLEFLVDLPRRCHEIWTMGVCEHVLHMYVKDTLDEAKYELEQSVRLIEEASRK